MEKTLRHRFEEKYTPEPMSGCWLWEAYCDKDGYGRFGIGGAAYRAHRVSWELHNGRIPDGMLVLHKCDVPECVNPDHLFLGSSADNISDMIAKGRAALGEALATYGNSKLNEDQVKQIFVAAGKHGDIGKKYNISRSQVWSIKNKRSWAKLTNRIEGKIE